MESRKRKPGRPAKPENRTRTRNLVIRMSDAEREGLDVIAEFLGVPSASEAFRVLVRGALEAAKKKRGKGRL